MARAIAIFVMLSAALPAWAGIYPPMPEPPFTFAPDGTAQPLFPNTFSQAYNDRLALMKNDVPPAEQASARRESLKRIEEKLPQATKLNTEELLALTGEMLRANQAEQVLKLLVPRSLERTPDFRLMVNLVQAYALSGDWDSAYRNYERLILDAEPPRGAPESNWRASIDKKYTERWLFYHRKYPRGTTVQEALPPIPLFGTGPLPPDAVAIVQQMALDAPNDIFLLWALAETTAKVGDYRTAAKLFDRCTNSGLTQPKALMARRAEVLDIVDKLPKVQETALTMPTVEPPSPPPAPKGLFDLIDPTKFYILGSAFVLIVVGLSALQIRAIRKRRRRR
jgi:tetratricopeptide (TPR) repeat protein